MPGLWYHWGIDAALINDVTSVVGTYKKQYARGRVKPKSWAKKGLGGKLFSWLDQSFSRPSSLSCSDWAFLSCARTERRHPEQLVVVYLHVGPNFQWQPYAAREHLLRNISQAGADIVWGTSSHHIQVRLTRVLMARV